MAKLPFENILFLDIETVPLVGDFAQLTDEMQHLWTDKFALLCARMPEKYPSDCTPALGFANSAGIYAEFGRIVCISVGYCSSKDGRRFLRTKSFAGHDERLLLNDFLQLVTRFFSTTGKMFCGHNIKEFDMPYICRRALVNGLTLPNVLQVAGKKPWEVPFLDTLEMWKFGDYKNYTPLKLLTALFGIPTPKDDIDGSEVARVFYAENNVARIAKYCQKDVVATAQVLLRMNGEPVVPETDIENTPWQSETD